MARRKRQGFALPNDVNAIGGFGDDVWGVDGLGIVYHRDDRWDPVAVLADASSNLYYIAGSAPADIWVGSAGSAAGTVFHFKDGRWTRATVCPRGMGDLTPAIAAARRATVLASNSIRAWPVLRELRRSRSDAEHQRFRSVPQLGQHLELQIPEIAAVASTVHNGLPDLQ